MRIIALKPVTVISLVLFGFMAGLATGFLMLRNTPSESSSAPDKAVAKANEQEIEAITIQAPDTLDGAARDGADDHSRMQHTYDAGDSENPGKKSESKKWKSIEKIAGRLKRLSPGLESRG